MLDKIYNLNIDLTNEKHSTPPSMRFRLNDELTSILIFTFSEDLDCFVDIYIKKPDGNEVYNRLTKQEDKYIYELTSQSKNVVGTYNFDLRIQNGLEVRIISGFYYEVKSDLISSNAIESSNEYGALTQTNILATQKATEAGNSASAAHISETNAKSSEDNAEIYAQQALSNILNGVSAHNTDEESHAFLISKFNEAINLAQGKSRGLAFDTKAQLDDWLIGEYEHPSGKTVDDLNIGDNLLIKELSVSDYWWTGTEISPLEAQAVNLTDYYIKTEVDALLPITLSRSEYDNLYNSGQIQAGRTYDIYEDD